MSFSSDVKKELSNVKPEKSCCARSELGGLYASMASLNLLGRGQVNVQFSSESLAVCRRAYTLLSQALHIAAQIHYVSSARFGGKRKCPRAAVCPGHDGKKRRRHLFSQSNHAQVASHPRLLHARVFARHASGWRHHDQSGTGLSSGNCLPG